jgi:hypothetical protein
VTDVFCENSNKGVQALAKERTDAGRRLKPAIRQAWERWRLDQRRALLNAMIDRIEVAPHRKGVQTHPVSADLIASRLDIRWLA